MTGVIYFINEPLNTLTFEINCVSTVDFNSIWQKKKKKKTDMAGSFFKS